MNTLIAISLAGGEPRLGIDGLAQVILRRQHPPYYRLVLGIGERQFELGILLIE